MVKKKTKNPPFLSHEFVIQNHADIVACVAMVFVLGLMFQMTSSLASVFIVMQHNTTANIEVSFLTNYANLKKEGVKGTCSFWLVPVTEQ